jgi:hypothetical protein
MIKRIIGIYEVKTNIALLNLVVSFTFFSFTFVVQKQQWVRLLVSYQESKQWHQAGLLVIIVYIFAIFKKFSFT